jgi:indole-3-glycerol phosphate synthase
MTGFLDQMAHSSAVRVAAAAARVPFNVLERRAFELPLAPALRLSSGGFDVIAEIKLRSPAAGPLGRDSDDWLGRACAYAGAGAAAVSVLTEPTRFDGSLEHLRAAAAALAPYGVPVMRKDFLVDAYQILEARVAGAGGVLVIARMLSRAQITELLDVAAAHHLFVLLEAFDAQDLALSAELLTLREGRDERILVGVNCRDLQTLEVVPQRFAELARQLPTAYAAVAESGVATASEAAATAQLGYRLALVGTALMVHVDPARLLAEIFEATRTVSC